MHKVDVFYAKIDDNVPDEDFKAIVNRFPIFLQKEIFTYKHRITALHLLTGKLLLEYALKKLKLSFTLADLKTTGKGRPYIDSTFDFNISHSGEWAVVAISDSKRVGVDIEKHRAIDIELFRKYFLDDEWNSIQQDQNPQQRFFDYWAIKESAIKCNGKGVELLGKTLVLNENMIKCDNDSFYYKHLSIAKQYASAISCEADFFVDLEFVYTLND